MNRVLVAVSCAAVAGAAATDAYICVITGGLTLDSGIGRRTRPFGPSTSTLPHPARLSSPVTMVQRDGGGEFAIGFEIVELVEPELIVLPSDPMPEVGHARSHDHVWGVSRSRREDANDAQRRGPTPLAAITLRPGGPPPSTGLAALVAG